MTVYDLCAKLQDYPLDLKVVVRNPDGIYYEVTKMQRTSVLMIDKATLRRTTKGISAAEVITPVLLLEQRYGDIEEGLKKAEKDRLTKVVMRKRRAKCR